MLLIVICTLVGAALFGGVAMLLPEQYTATTSVLVRPLDGNPYSPNTQGSDLTNLETEAQIVRSDVIVARVEQSTLAGPSGGVDRSALAVSVAPNTQIVQIAFSDSSPRVAAQVSEEFARSYLDYRQERRDATVDAGRAALANRIASVNETLDKLRRQNRPEDDPEMRSVGGQLLNLRLQLATLDAAEIYPGELISQTPARRSGIAVSPLVAALAGAALGLAAGVGLALLRERTNEPLRTVDDVEHLGVPVLGHVAASGSVDVTPSDPALMVGAVINRRVTRPATVAVTLVRSNPSEAGFVEDLAHALSHGAQDVLVVVGGTTGPADGAHGLSEVLKGRPLSRVVRKDPRGFSTVGPGRSPSEGERWYATMRFTALLQESTETFGLVLVDGGGADQTAGRALVGACDYWIPLIALGHTSRHDLERGISWAETVGTRVLGVVALDPTRHRTRARSARAAPPDD